MISSILVSVIILVLGGLLSLYLIRFFQKYLVYSVANLYEFIQPERERKGNGLIILIKVIINGLLLLYLVGAWCAICVSIPRSFQQSSSLVFWIGLILGLIICLVIIASSTKIALGFSDPEKLNSDIHLNTKAKWSKADNAFMFAVSSSTILFWLTFITWLLFAILPSLPSLFYGYLTNQLPL